MPSRFGLIAAIDQTTVAVRRDFCHMTAQTDAIETLILHFHGLGAPPIDVPSDEVPYWCDAERFESILDRIKVLRASLPIEITFDDGNLSDLTIAAPALLKRNMTSVFFVCAGRIGKTGYLTSGDIRELNDLGMPIGSHGMHHLDWRKADDATLVDEIDTACARLSDILGKLVDTISIPFGSYDRRVLGQLRARPLRSVYTSDGGLARPGHWLQPREVFRQSWNDEVTLSAMASAKPSMALKLRRRLALTIKAWR